MPIQLEKARLNLFNLAGFAIVGITTAFGWGIIYNRMTTANETAAAQIASVRNDLTTISSQLPQLNALQFQMTRVLELIAEQKSGLQDNNNRIDRIVESFGGKLDAIGANINTLTTRVEVLATQTGTNKK